MFLSSSQVYDVIVCIHGFNPTLPAKRCRDCDKEDLEEVTSNGSLRESEVTDQKRVPT